MKQIQILFEGEESVLKKSQVEDFPVVADKKSKELIVYW